VNVRYWGARGSIPAPGRDMAGYGGNTSCVQLGLSDGSEVILDAGTGIRELGHLRAHGPRTVHVLLTHLHLDHIQGLMFFAPLFNPECEVRIWGPAALDGPLLQRLARYISAPLAPVELRELPAQVTFEETTEGIFDLGPARVEAEYVNHRGPTLGYRITDAGSTVAYIPDHEPALGQEVATSNPDWISGSALARDADLLIHDCQYTDAEYRSHLGWGHSAISDTLAFAHRAHVRKLALFHHDPLHDDHALDELGEEARSIDDGRLEHVGVAREGESVEL
jgi:phosphoribosyl 1,2-cyclic phosphodiesterase